MTEEASPNRWKVERPYVTLDLIQLKGGIKSVVIHRQVYFTKQLDSAKWSITDKDQTRSGDIALDEVESVLDRCGSDTLSVRIQMYHREETPQRHFLLPPEQYVTVAIDFARRQFFCEVATIGSENAQVICTFLTFGQNLMPIQLPPEHAYLENCLSKFSEDNVDFRKNLFLIMRFQNQNPFPEIVATIRRVCDTHGLKALRADDREYTDDVWDNVMTYMYGCSSAIAVFDQINYREFNPNVALEVGFMLAQRKPVLLLKDTAIPALPTDIVGKRYRPFDTYDPIITIPPQIGKWIADFRIGEQ